jgi:hypothetical protein
VNKKIGTSSLKELEEGSGITFKNSPDMKLASYYFDQNKCLRMLVFSKVNMKDIQFTEASHVWESKNFTLVPLNKDYMKTYEIGTFLEGGIHKANKKCATYITYNDKNEALNKIYSDNAIKQQDNTYFIKLTNEPKLSDKELKMLRKLNKKINGYDDTKYVYKDDYICKYEYVPFGKSMVLTISPNFKRNFMKTGYMYDVQANYKQLIDSLYQENSQKNLIPYKSTDNDLVKSFFEVILL